MATLTVASKANQATTLPAVLVASYANELDPNASVTIKFEEVDGVKCGDGASVQLVFENSPPVYGSEKAIEQLFETYLVLQGKHQNSVGSIFRLEILGGGGISLTARR